MSYPPFVPARPKTLPGEPSNLDAPNRSFSSDRNAMIQPRDSGRPLESAVSQDWRSPERDERPRRVELSQPCVRS